MPEALVIIDMQEHFINRKAHQDHYPLVIDNTIKQIALAIRRDAPIFFVEYNCTARAKEKFSKKPSDQPTLKELIDLTDGYDKRYFVYKKNLCGGHELLEAFDNYKVDRGRIRVCGVYTTACVLSTVRTFMELSSVTKAKIVQNAVSNGSSEPSWNKEAIHTLATCAPRISVMGPSLW